MGRKGLTHLINVGIGNGEVISIGVVRKSSDWKNVETKKFNSVGDIHYTCALRDPYPGMKRG